MGNNETWNAGSGGKAVDSPPYLLAYAVHILFIFVGAVSSRFDYTRMVPVYLAVLGAVLVSLFANESLYRTKIKWVVFHDNNFVLVWGMLKKQVSYDSVRGIEQYNDNVIACRVMLKKGYVLVPRFTQGSLGWWRLTGALQTQAATAETAVVKPATPLVSRRWPFIVLVIVYCLLTTLTVIRILYFPPTIAIKAANILFLVVCYAFYTGYNRLHERLFANALVTCAEVLSMVAWGGMAFFYALL